jgi:proteasome lid subunit RPN8/RPN11
MLPADATVVGIAHSHPSGVVEPSTQDLLQFFGRIMVIMGYPYRDSDDVAVFDREGNRVAFTVI